VNQDTVINLALDAMSVSMRVGMPMLLAGLAVGLAVSIFQAVTQIQEQTLAFIPKVVAMAVVVVIGGPWMLGQVIAYTQELYSAIPTLVGGG
jgi:flagellar biosynthetic protein FliQ